MRKIPVVVSGDFDKIVGFLEIDEDLVPDRQLVDMHVSWLWNPDKQQVTTVSFNPMLRMARQSEYICHDCRNGEHGLCESRHCVCRKHGVYEHPEPKEQ